MPTYLNPSSQKARRRKQSLISRFKHNWAIGNIFSFRKPDGIAYVILYIVLPVCMTSFSLLELSNNMTSAAYCYFTIFISGLNCIYDAANRLDFGQYTTKNAKLWFIIISCSIVSLYGFIEMIAIFCSQSLKYRCDYFLLSFLAVIAIAFTDVVAISGTYKALQDAVNG